MQAIVLLLNDSSNWVSWFDWEEIFKLIVKKLLCTYVSAVCVCVCAHTGEMDKYGEERELVGEISI